jgi:probable O-glycosylation ligase (exosortase A-associated)
VAPVLQCLNAVNVPLRLAPLPMAPPSPQSPVAAADRQWDLLTVCLVGHVFNAVGRLNNMFEVLKPFHLVLVFASLALALYMLDRRPTRRLELVLRTRTTFCVLALGVWMALSVPAALSQRAAFDAFTDEFAKAVIMYLVIAGAARGFFDVERVAFAYLASVGLYAGVVLARFNVGGDQWRLGALYAYDANDFATLAVMCLPLGVYFLFRSRPLWRRLVSAVALGLLGIAFVWSGSRGGFLALVAVAAFLLLQYRAIPMRWRMLTTAALAVLFVSTASGTFWDKMKTVVEPGEDYNLTSDAGRIAIWQRGMGYMLEYPLLGVGPGNFPTAEGTISSVAQRTPSWRGVRWSAAHNSFVQVAAELGIPGLVLFLGMLGSAFGALRAVRRRFPYRPGERSPPPAQLADAMTASLIAFVVGGFFLSLAYRDLLYTMLALVIALWKVARAVPVAPRPAPSRR